MERKAKLLQIRVDEVFLKKIEYLKKIHSFQSNAETVRKIVDKEFKKEIEWKKMENRKAEIEVLEQERRTENTLHDLKSIIEEYKSRGAFSCSQQVKYMEEGKQVALVWVLAEVDKKIEAIRQENKAES